MLASLFSKLCSHTDLKNRTFNLLHKRFYIMDKLSTIGTHDGTFHCDEALGCYMLKLLSPNARIVRSRDEDILKTCDIVIDVGGEYNPDNKRFDHHQKEFNVTADSFIPGKSFNIKLSSAGLVYCHFGKSILKKILGDVDDNAINILFPRVYEGFIQEIDAIDNGVPICDGEMRYYISTHVSARVKHINPGWNEYDSDIEIAFGKAMDLVGLEFKNKVQRLYHDWWPARTIVLDALNKRKDVDSSGEIVELSEFCPWTTHLFELEKELGIENQIKYVLFPATQSRSIWRVQSVPKEDGSFILRHPLHEDWRGIRGEELSKLSGIDGSIFVHFSGFIGGNATREGVLEMARKSLKKC